MRSIVALAVAGLVSSVAFADADRPLRLELVPARGETTIHIVAVRADKTTNEIDMRLPWSVGEVGPDGTAMVRIGPPSFSGPGKAPPWPKGGYAEFALSASNRDHDWTTGLAPGAKPEEMQRLQQLLTPQYATAVGIVRLATTAVKVGGGWSFDEHETDAEGPLVTRYTYRLLARDGKRVRIATEQSTRREGGKTPVTMQTVRGEIAYDLDKPLPVAGWIEMSWRDGSITQRYR